MHVSLFNPCPKSFEPGPYRPKKYGPKAFRDYLLEQKAKGHTSEQIALDLGLGKSTVQLWLKEQRHSAHEKIVDIAYAKLGIPLTAWPAKRSGPRSMDQ